VRAEIQAPSVSRDAWGRVWAIGKRKTSVARVRLRAGDGHVAVNGACVCVCRVLTLTARASRAQ
jgi:ribosomal protein S9